MEPINKNLINIQRPAFKQNDFDSEFKLKIDTNKNKLIKNNFDPRRLLNIFTILNLITEYNFKKDLIADLFSGFTVGIMHIPVSLAYGALTSLNPVNGLYTSFYSGLTYLLFGTSKHLSVGTYAVISLMVYSVIQRLESEYLESNEYYLLNLNSTNNNYNNTIIINNLDDDHIMKFRIKVATSLAFWCGCVQIVLALFKFGIIYKYLSKVMLRAFSTAAACYVFTTQLQHIFGIYPKIRNNKLNIPFMKLFYVI
jgi:solute carrier family 26 (sulfate anion transporter), member 6